ncbi:DUF5666 domain-containing protein [Kineosporia succinea]|uniref:DUF5666 domain-containing protein n=1 Tax=Kineosporia succinea TaxID=84632 RepID=A0ABT9P2A0_9ACTN|nr:DUF5666 domain-containing protein [Kineosporia succinea]MDP9826809.1 hypothetical protein [Kineosporia succinea]
MEPAPPTAPAGIDRTEIQAGPSRGGYIPPADDDLDLLAESNRRMGKVTIALMAAVLAGLAFIGGVVVQKQFGNSSAGAPGGGMSAMGGNRSGGYGQSGGVQGGYGGGGGFGGGGMPGQGSGTAQGGSAAQSETASTPVVVGTVTRISGTTIVVKNFSDKSVTVKVPQGTTVSSSTDSALTGLSKGDSVSVAGTTADDGVVTATSITAS